MAGTTRTLEDVNVSAEAAGLKRMGLVQVLRFSTSAISEEYKLLELNSDVLSRLESGDNLIIRGGNQDDAVLCTPDKTYEIKAADTSNTLLLVPQCFTTKDPGFKNFSTALIEQEVCGKHSLYYEMKPCRPKLSRLKYLLQQSLYKGPECEAYQKEQKYSFEDLLNLVQASNEQLNEALVNLQAVNIDGYWRLLDNDFQERVFIRILTLLEEKDWSYDRVPMKECCDILEELEPRFALEHCLNYYGERIDNMEVNEDGGSEVYFRLLEDKVCRFYAEYLLRPAGRGIALEDMNSHPPIIWHFPSSDLPENPELRFNKLFKTRSKWTLEEIQPYIKELEGPGQPLKSLLLKYARSSKDACGITVYSSKRPLL